MSEKPEATPVTQPAAVATPWSLLSNPYGQISLSIVLSAAAQLLLKLGADEEASQGWSGFSGLHSGWVWLGIAAMVGSLFSWLHALRSIPLSLAFTLAGAIHVLVPLGSWIWLGETISARRWLGISLVTAGVLISVRPATVVEEKL